MHAVGVLRAHNPHGSTKFVIARGRDPVGLAAARCGDFRHAGDIANGVVIVLNGAARRECRGTAQAIAIVGDERISHALESTVSRGIPVSVGDGIAVGIRDATLAPACVKLGRDRVTLLVVGTNGPVGSIVVKGQDVAIGVGDGLQSIPA